MCYYSMLFAISFTVKYFYYSFNDFFRDNGPHPHHCAALCSDYSILAPTLCVYSRANITLHITSLSSIIFSVCHFSRSNSMYIDPSHCVLQLLLWIQSEHLFIVLLHFTNSSSSLPKLPNHLLSSLLQSFYFQF